MEILCVAQRDGYDLSQPEDRLFYPQERGPFSSGCGMIVRTKIFEEIKKRKGIQKIFGNMSWLISGNIIQLGIGLMISILVARYLGPEKYGILSYALSVIGFLGTFTYLGLSGLVVRDIVCFPDEKDMLLGTTFFLKFLGGVFAFLVVIGLALITHDFGGIEFWVLLIMGLSLFAGPFEVIDLWFQSKVQSKYTVIASSTAIMAGAAIKVLIVLIGGSVVAIVAASSLQSILTSIFLVYIYHYNGFSILKWKVQISTARQLLSRSWILILAGFFALVNFKVDQIMLRWMSGAAEVGIYSVAVMFSEIWYFMASAIALSVFPRLIELRESDPSIYEKKLQQIFDVLFALSFSVALAMNFVATPFIRFLYGEAYVRAAAILSIHVWAGIFMFMQQITNKFVLMENILIFHLANQGTAAIFNIFLNVFLIPKYGGLGAAVSTLISYAASSYLFLFLYKKTRTLAVKISKSYIFPLRLIIYRANIWN
jgi:O-antigen/teichoic acid export membrane protein